MLKLLVLFVVLTPFTSTSQTTSKKRNAGELVIHGTLNNKRETIPYIYMICLDGNKGGLDSVKVASNKFDIRIQTGVTTLITLYMKPPSSPDHLNGKYLLTLITEPTTIDIFTTDSFSNAKVSGSKVYSEYSKLERQRGPYYRQLRALSADYSTMKENAGADGLKELQARIDSTKNILHSNYYDYIKANPSSLLVPYALNGYMAGLQGNPSDEEIGKVEQVYNKLSRKEKSAYYGKRIKKRLDSYRITIGTMAPVFAQNDTLGNPVSLASFKGRYVLLDFWASWCAPCREENPNLVKAFNKYKSKGFTILSVSLDKPGDKEKWMRAIQKDALTWTHVSDLQYWNNAAATLYKVSSIPQNFLLDPSGKIIGKNLRGNSLEKKLRGILN